jgi:hypothetical protein
MRVPATAGKYNISRFFTIKSKLYSIGLKF